MSQVTSKLLAVALVALLGVGAVVLAQPGEPPPAVDSTNGSATAQPAVEEESPLLAEPTTPDGFFNAAVLMIKLARPKLAKDYLQKLLETNPSDDALLSLRDKQGPAVFLNLANNPELQPFATQLLERVNQLVRDRSADPARIDSLINDLIGDPSKQEVALVSLRNTGAIAVPRIVLQLGNPELVARHTVLIHTLSRMGADVIPPLIGALESPNESIRGAAIDALGLLMAREAVPYLWYPAYASDQPPGIQASARMALGRILGLSAQQLATSRMTALKELNDAALEQLRRDYRWTAGEDGTVVIWTWQPDIGTVAPNRVTPDAASYYVGARLAKQSLGLDEDDRDAQELYLALGLANDAQRVGWDQPLPTGEGTAYDLALTSGRDVVLGVVALALEAQNPAAALGALEVLRKIGTRNELVFSRGKPSPLIAALNYPDPRVQFSDAVTILSLDPDRPFAGSQRVVEILVRALQSSATARSVVVDADLQRGDTVGALLDQIGYPAEVVPTGREGFAAAARSSDVSLILLQTNTIRWPLSQTIANLRADSRTANIPIAIFGMEGTQSRVESLTRRYRLVTFILEPSSPDGMKYRIQPFLSSIQTPPISTAEHERQSAVAVDLLARIAASHRTDIFDLAPAEAALAAALNDPNLAPGALFALAAIKTKTAQGTLLDVALSANSAMELRVQAAQQLAAHIQRYGLLLADTHVVDLKHAWKSANDPQLQTSLAAVVGALSPDPQKVGSRLKGSPDPMVVPAQP